jgi:WD40 repeat protein/serine/threonine protein kinase/tetratricopeptide (TPR) repeat protein
MNEHELFAAALEIGAPAERSAYLDRACGGDDVMRARVEALLRAHEQAGSFLAARPVAGSATLDAPKPLEGPGTVIGAYKLLQTIGEGGMGVVYMAEQTRPVRRTVALKVIKAGMDTRQVLARFGAERQALALMDHPNIARVLDAGATETGRPYFVMELVKGMPITRFCDDRRLTLRERLELFIPVCQAVQHAHQKGIIHRDLKASNVLIALYDGKPVPKVIDFGVAKATGPRLTDQTLYTEFGAVVGTLEYMSPEQAELNQLDIDTRSDIYSLGVLLYELLTGTTPLDRKRLSQGAILEMLRIIREEDSPRPSMRLSTIEELPSIAAFRQVEPRKLSGLVRGELDWIVMKALEKDRTRRYETASGLAADLRRYLDDEPVLAGPPSSWYRLRKFARRNRALVATAAVVATALVAVAALTALYADRQRHFAIEQTKATRKITDLATDLGKERESLRKSLSESDRLLAIRNFERGQAACEQGEIGPGMLWMIESWRSAVAANDPAWQHAARANLAAWRPHYPRLKAVLSHAMPVSGAAFSPDSRTVILGSMDGRAQLWDADSGRKIGRSLQVGGEDVGVAFSPDGKTVLTFSEGRTAQLWDPTKGEPLGLPLRLPPQFYLCGVAIPDEGKFVLVGTEDDELKILRLWDAGTGKPIGPPLTHRGHNSALSPDGRMILVLSDDGTVRILDVATRQPIGRPLERLRIFRTAAWSPDGKTILTGSEDGTAQLWDAATGKSLVPPMRHESEVRSVALSPDGKTALTGCQDKQARLWDAATGQFIGPLEHQGGIRALAFSPDGKTMLTGSLDGTVRLWDAEPGKLVGQVLEIPSTDYIGELSPDGKFVISLPEEPNYQRYVQLWNATTRQPISRLPQPCGNVDVKVSPDGKVLLTQEADHTARLWDVTTGVALGVRFPLPSPVNQTGWSPGCLGPDGKTVLFVAKDRRVWIFDGATGSMRGRTPALGGYAYGLDFTPDGKTFFTGLDNGEVQLWDALTVTPLGDPNVNPGATSGGLFGRDGKSLLIPCEDGTVRLWHVATWKQLIPPLRHRGPVSMLAFSPDNKIIATGSPSQSTDKSTRLWDLATGQHIGRTQRHTRGVGVAFPAHYDPAVRLSTVSGPFPIPLNLPDELERIATWVEVITGLRLDKQQGLIQVLDNAAWLERRERLMQLGGSPETGPELRIDSILFGPDPTARARSFMERKQWDAAEAAFDEAMQARPFNIAIMVERGDLHTRRGLWSQAAAYYATTVTKYPEVAPLHEQLVVTRLLAGELPGYRAACAEMLKRFKPIDDSNAAVRVAYACSLAAEAVSDMQGLIEVSKRSTRWVASNERAVGAVLFRAGRLEEALKRFEQGQKVFEPRAWDWLFLAMIHSRLGHKTEAHRFLQQADQWIVAADKAPPAAEEEGPRWASPVEKPTILLLRSEAEAVVRCDPVFPTDPFAPKGRVDSGSTDKPRFSGAG